MRWTDAQRSAIDARGSNLLVAAAAGSGKTAVMVERICALVREGIPIDRMLVVTFTAAAAAEMREKIVRAFQDAAEGDANQAAWFAEQAVRVERAQISTIHGFCGALLRTHFSAVGIDPTFRVGEEKESKGLPSAALLECIGEAYTEGTEDFIALSDCFSDQQIAEQVRELLSALESQPDPEGWLSDAIAAYATNDAALASGAWMRTVLSGATEAIDQALATCLQAIRICEQPGGCVPYIATMEADAQNLRMLREAATCGYEALVQALQGYKPPRIAQADKNADPGLTAQAKALRDAAKEMVKKRLFDRGLDRPLDEHAQDIRAQAPQIRALAALAMDVRRRYAEMKQSQNILDFADLEHKAIEAVRQSAVAAQVRAQFDAIFVDEYQDSSAMQEALIGSIAGERNTFLVGDVKQSIYRFRRAEPKLFLQKYRSYADQSGAADRRIDLNQNFRSSRNVLASVNDTFAYAMREDVTEIAYDQAARLNPSERALPGPATELHIVLSDRADDDGDQDSGEGVGEALDEENVSRETMEEAWWQDLPALRKNIEKEAAIAAARIHALVDTEYEDAKLGEKRKLQFRDIVILLRVSSGVAQAVQTVLEAEGIPVYSDTGGAYFAMPEVRMVIDLMRVVDNPLRDDALLGALRGPAARLTNATLASIRKAHPDGSFAQAMAHSTAQNDELGERLRAFIRQMEAFRLLAQAQPLEQLVWRICEETGCYARAGAMPGGRTRQANLRLLAERAAVFSRTRGGGLTAFLDEVEQLTNQGDSDSAKALSEGENVVRIMTMHKSKGLEFPVVLCLDMGRSFTRGPRAGSALSCHSELGLALKFVDARLRTRHDTIAQQAQRVKRAQEQLADAARLLYVAMTRAQSQLILIGSMAGRGDADPLADRLQRWCAAEPGTLLSEASTLLDFLLPPLLTHPDGDALRQIEECGEDDRDSESRWQITLHHGVADVIQPSREAGEILSSLQALHVAPDAEVERMLAWQPPAPGGEAVWLKTSVSSLLRGQKTGEDVWRDTPSLPEFLMARQALGGAEKGTAFHTAMRGLTLVPLRGLSGTPLMDAITAQLDALVARQILTDGERQAVDAGDIAALLASPTGQAMLASEQVRREWAFNLRAPGQTHTQLIQGVLDCCFDTSEGWVLLDYKTDVAPSPEIVLARYAPQISLYAEALTRITGRPIAQRALYLTHQRAVHFYPKEVTPC